VTSQAIFGSDTGGYSREAPMTPALSIRIVTAGTPRA
jgi:hypothetical protein